MSTKKSQVSPTSQKTRQAKRWRTASRKADMATCVRLATPLARELVTLGMCDIGRVCDPDKQALPFHIEELIGYDATAAVDDDALSAVEESQEAALALGIAIGLLLRQEAFSGGVR